MQRKFLFFMLLPLQLFAAFFEEGETEVRGFLYHKVGDIWILASEPNLKTCCVGSEKKIENQLIIKGNFPNHSPAYVVTMRGKVKKAPQFDKTGRLVQLYILEEAELVQK